MAVPKKHKARIEKFVRIVLEKVVSEEIPRVFFRRGQLDEKYQICIYSGGLLPQFNDDRIGVNGDVNGKKIDFFYVSGESLQNNKLDDKLVKDIVEAFLKLRVK